MSTNDDATKRAHVEWLRFDDLQELGIVDNWQTLKNWQTNYGFPLGRKFGPNSRRWNRGEVETWADTRPVERKPKIRRRDERAA